SGLMRLPVFVVVYWNSNTHAIKMSLHTCGTIRQLFKIINSQHPIILANIQTISSLTALVRVGQFFKSIY
ncbi:MAG: hypothetical protein WB664_07980, partial [Nitrososphaeraceae archaeon]